MNEETEQLMNDPAMVEKAFSDPEMRKLPLGSPEFNAALTNVSETDAEDGDEDTPADVGDNEQDDGKPIETKKSRGRDRRIDQLTAKIGVLERQAAQRQAEPAPPRETFTPSSEKPQFANYSNLEDYTEAMTEWKLDAREEAKAEADAQGARKAKAEQFVETWSSKEVEAKKDYTDYDDVVNPTTLTSVNPSNEAKLYLSECDDGPRTIYALMANQELAEKFASASAVQQVAMLAKLDASNAGSDVSTKTIASKAPEPPRNLPSGKTASVSRNILENAAEMSFEEWDRQVSQVMRNKKR